MVVPLDFFGGLGSTVLSHVHDVDLFPRGKHSILSSQEFLPAL